MPNGNSEATLENWVKDIDGKVDGIGQSIVRIETYLDSGHMTSAQNREDINRLRDDWNETQNEVHSIQRNNEFLRGQVAMLKLLGSIVVGAAIILEAIKMWSG